MAFLLKWPTENNCTPKHRVAAFKEDHLLILINFSQVAELLASCLLTKGSHTRIADWVIGPVAAPKALSKTTDLWPSSHRCTCGILNSELGTPTHWKVLVDNISWRLYNCLSKPCKLFHFVNIQVGDGSYLILSEHLQNLEWDVFLSDNHIRRDKLDFLLKNLKVVIFLVDYTVDIHILVLHSLTLLINISHEPKRTFKEKNFWVVDFPWHLFISQVLHKHTSIDVLWLWLVLKI